MFVKYTGDGARPLCGSTVVNKRKASHVSSEEKLKKLIDRGYTFVILDNKEWVDAEEYFKEDKVESVVETAKIETVEEVEDEPEVIENDEDNVLDYSELFEDFSHWTDKPKNVEEFTDDPEVVEEIIEYAKATGESDGVVKRINKYKESL